jgi:fimbrial chaperone protein
MNSLMWTATTRAQHRRDGLRFASDLTDAEWASSNRCFQSLRLSNPGDAPASFEIDAFAWSQTADSDIQEPTDDLIASPPEATIPQGGSQVVRLLLRRPPARQEVAYRVHVSELPAPGNARVREQILFQVTSSLPVFVVPPSPVPGHLQWRLDRSADGEVALLARNDGGRFMRIAQLQATTLDGRRVDLKSTGSTPYVLPGIERRWTIGGTGTAGALRLRGTTQTGPFDQVVTLGG